MKTCRVCGLPRRLDDYHRNRTRPDGRCAECRTCRSLWNRGTTVDEIRAAVGAAATEK